jgi:hypothetical protein
MAVSDMNIPILLGSATCWAPGTGGRVDVQTLAENDESVTFTGVLAGDYFGYELFIDNATSSTPGTPRPYQIGDPTFTLESDGTYTVTYAITKVTAAQAGATCQLLIIK